MSFRIAFLPGTAQRMAHQSTRRRVPALLACCAAALLMAPWSSALQAQSRIRRPAPLPVAQGTAGLPTAGSRTEDPPRVALVSSNDHLLLQIEAFPVEVISNSPRKGTALVEAPAGTSASALADLIQDLSQLPGMLVTELDQRVFTHETEGCQAASHGGVTQVGAQQCTVAFVDGTPTLPEYISQSALQQINAFPAQQLSATYAPVVAVIDTGLDPSLALFSGHWAGPGYDFVAGRPRGWDLANGIDDDDDRLVDEAFGHGTHIAGTIIAVAPNALILPVRVLDSDGNGTAYNVASGIFWAVDHGADLINLSLSMENVSLTVAGALQYAEANGVPVFTSAGNTGDDILFPGNYDPANINYVLPGLENETFDGAEIVTVAAVDDVDVKAAFSAWGAEINVSAPGVAVYSALPNNDFGWWSGTSMATAVASGAAALSISIAGPGSATAVAQLIIDESLPIDGKNPQTVGGLGSGRIDALATAVAVVPLF
jgi:subtilisin family serine protease